MSRHGSWWPAAVAALLVAALGAATYLPLPVAVTATAGLLLALAVPAWLLSAKADTGRSGVAHWYLSYALVLLGIMALVLLWNTVAYAAGLSDPLDSVYLRALVIVAALALVAWRPTSTPTIPVRRLLRWVVRPLGLAHLPVVVGGVTVLVAVAGAVELNNGGSPALAVTGLGLGGLTLGGLMTIPGSPARDAIGLTLVSAAVVLGTSLRSWHIIGHDIQREYLFFQIASALEHWDIREYADPYNACLSITLLPVALQALTGLSDFMIFKVVLPLLFAPIVAALYALAVRVVPRHLAITAVTFFIAFPTFYIDMSYLLRQAVAFVFLAGFVLLVAGDEDDPGWRRRLLAIAMGLGVVLSHYSTTYVLALTLLIASVARIAYRLIRTRVGVRRESEPFAVRGMVVLHPVVVVIVTAMSITWSGAITNTGGHLRGVLGETLSAVVTGEAAPRASELRRALFAPPEAAQDKLDDYSRELLEDTQQRREDGAFLETTEAERFPRAAEIPGVEPTGLGEAVEDAGLDTETFTGRLRLLSGVVLQLLTAVGLALALFRPRRLGSVPEDLRWMWVGTAGAVMLFVVGPGLSAEYGFLRSLQQALVVWGTLAAATLALLTRRLPGGRTVAVVLTVLLFVNITGMTSRLVGGYEPQLNVANEGFYDDLYNYDDAEVAGMQWAIDFARQRATAEIDPPLVLTDRSNTADFMDARTPVPPGGTSELFFGEIFPSTIPVDATVYLPEFPAREGKSSDFIGGDIIAYEFPLDVLDRSKNLLYNNGYSRVYR